MFTDYIKYGILLIIIVILQITLVDFISYGQIKGDIILITLIYITLTLGQIPGIILAFFSGLIFDLLSGNLIGANSLSKVIVIFFVGYFYDEQFNERLIRSYIFLIIVFISSIIERAIYTFISTDLDFKYLILTIVNYSLFPSIMNTMLSTLVFLLPKRSELRL